MTPSPRLVLATALLAALPTAAPARTAEVLHFPAGEVLEFLEAPCVLDGNRPRTLRGGSLAFLVVESFGLDERRLLPVDAAELPSWRGGFGERIRTTLPFRSGPGFLIARAVQRIAEPVRLSAADSLRGAWPIVTAPVAEVREARRLHEADVELWKADHGD